ncbi:MULTISPECIES: hypothetical protein [unclassified Sphaerospermopsis]|uniref:hypothetical protein n=1 Tax=unclassified Sphaerospermopsis TaxID=2646443 RepID=UPI0016807297|nr:MULTISPECIES: hypothetical protein [unclassified Sphaerospermopsis]MBD2133660.1 hypothetical protein [Sphaerospermopsis sp. FACHB-1094]MBD2146159.1 hypothetical protein [Sphaerospermopsis sp. FACHB-1194]
MIIYRPNASPLQENNLGQKLIIGRPNADASSTLRERPYRSQEVGEVNNPITNYQSPITNHQSPVPYIQPVVQCKEIFKLSKPIQ